MTLQGKSILVCGGASGIGKAAAICLAKQGARLALGDCDSALAQETVQQIVDDGGDAFALTYDQSVPDSVASLVADVGARCGGLDGVLANVADTRALNEDTDLLSIDPAIWERTIKVNLTGTQTVLRHALPHLLSRGGGSIVCMSSGAASIGEAQRPAYAVSKAGINALCRHVSSRWGSEGIRCNAIAPGLIVTETVERNLPAEVLDQLLKGYHSPRHGKPSDIASAVAYLMSDAGAWVNGQVWHINGGIYYAN